MEELTAAAGTSARTRTMEEITAEAIRHQMDGADAVIGLGNCLIEAKSMLAHGEWLSWMAENLNLSERSAQELMQIARNCSNPRALADLGKKKVLTILTLPPADRALFLDGDYIPEGADKSVSNMTTRELQQVIRERDEARKACSAAEELRQKTAQENLRIAADAEKAKADAANAEASRQKMEADMAVLKRELEELKEHPVTVEAVVQADETALEHARQEVRDELREQLDKATAAKQKAEENLEAQKQKAEKELNAQKSETDRLQQRIREMEAAVTAAEQKAAEAVKEAGIRNNPKLSAFEEYYNQTQTLANKMNDIILELLRDDPDTAGKLGKALIALGDMIKEAAAAKETAA